MQSLQEFKLQMVEQIDRYIHIDRERKKDRYIERERERKTQREKEKEKD